MAESITSGMLLKGIVIGIGLNLISDIETLSQIDQPATSLNLEIKSDIDKMLLVNEILSEFENNYEKYTKNK